MANATRKSLMGYARIAIMGAVMVLALMAAFRVADFCVAVYLYGMGSVVVGDIAVEFSGNNRLAVSNGDEIVGRTIDVRNGLGMAP